MTNPGRFRVSLAAALILAAANFGCAADSSRALSRAFLFGDAEFIAPLAMQEFSTGKTATRPSHVFSGSLRLPGTAQTGHFAALHDPFDLVGKIGEPIRSLPEFDFEFVQRGDDVVPLRRGVIRRSHPHWEIILQPGKAWSEPGDGDWTRASVPFALQERSANCTHNGVLTWLFNDDGEVSRVAYQVSSETCAYFKFDLWGVADAEYLPQDLSTSAAPHFDRLDVHRKSRLPQRPLADLAKDYPAVDALGVGDGIAPDDLTVFGMVVDGVNYRSDCRTRQGPHPYCDSLPLPSYSTAKSIFAGIATMRLEKLYPGSSQLTIGSLIDECDTMQWRDVTIENALDMTTGNFNTVVPYADEDLAPHVQFIDADNHREKLQFACHFFKRKAAPGTQFVYHTSDTYLVGAALGQILASEDSGADLYESVLVRPIWHELKLSPLLDVSKRTYDQSNQAYVGYGLTYEVDDIIRIAAWLYESRGRINGEPMLDAAMLDAALQLAPADRGLEAGSSDTLYNNGFLAFNAGPSIGCEEPVWVPFMSGYGGITVAMFPNSVVYYYFSDSYVFHWQSARTVANAISDMCEVSESG